MIPKWLKPKTIALREAITKAIHLRYQRMIILVGDKDRERVWSNNHLATWQLAPSVLDIKNLIQQHDLQLQIKVAPKLISRETKSMAITVSRFFYKCES
jgi:hypothetical protein